MELSINIFYHNPMGLSPEPILKSKSRLVKIFHSLIALSFLHTEMSPASVFGNVNRFSLAISGSMVPQKKNQNPYQKR